MIRIRSTATAIGLTLFLAACGSSNDSSTESADAAPKVAAGFPVTIKNCGENDTYDKAPTRAVTMNQHVTEILLALGLEKHMVGTGYMDSTVRPDLKTVYDTVPVLAKEYPSKEKVLATDPDLVIGGFSSAFEDKAAGTRTSLRDLGIGSYLTNAYCPDVTTAASLSLVERDITDLGRIFGVPDRAKQLIAKMTTPVTETRSALDGTTPTKVFVYDSGTDKAFTAAGYEMTTALVKEAGGTNIFSDVKDDWTEVSWEDVVDRQPDAILILNYGDTSVAEKEKFLASHPVASTLDAVKERRYVVVDLTDVAPGIRNGDVIATIAKGLHPDRF